jgi:cytosolic carboxypeptidase protein 2/3
MFRYYSCVFKINECKITTARAILLRRLGIPLSSTLETSNGCYFDYEALKDVPFTKEKWNEVGFKTAVALYEYTDLLIAADRTRWEKKQAKKEKEPAKKEKKGRSKQKVREKPSIFSAMENEKIRHLFEEIKQAEVNKPKEHNSDD